MLTIHKPRSQLRNFHVQGSGSFSGQKVKQCTTCLQGQGEALIKCVGSIVMH